MAAESLTPTAEPGFTEEQERAAEIGSYAEDDLGQYLDALTGREAQHLIHLLRRVREEHERRAKAAHITERLVREILHGRANVGLGDLRTDDPESTVREILHGRAEASVMPAPVRTPEYVLRDVPMETTRRHSEDGPY